MRMLINFDSGLVYIFFLVEKKKKMSKKKMITNELSIAVTIGDYGQGTLPKN